jgi:hypothetical protein
VLVTGALRPSQELLNRPVISGPRVSVADRDREKFEEPLAGCGAGARDECGSLERIYRNDDEFGVRCRFQLKRRLSTDEFPSEVFVLGRRFSGLVAIQPGHTLVTTGVYSVIRHPSYLGLLVNSLGWGLAFRSGVGVLLTALSIPPLLARIRAEEMLLRTQFGADYDAYRARTSRLIPGLY